MGELFREVEHTGDLAIVVHGVGLVDLFTRAGLSLFALLLETDAPRGTERHRVDVRGRDREDLLHEWLSRLLTDFYAEGFIAARIAVESLEDTRIVAELEGERFASSRHRLLREIKAVTYYGLAVRETAGGWEARITFDV